MSPLIGAHVKSDDPLAMAAETGADLVQIFIGDPQSWKKPPPREDADALQGVRDPGVCALAVSGEPGLAQPQDPYPVAARSFSSAATRRRRSAPSV